MQLISKLILFLILIVELKANFSLNNTNEHLLLEKLLNNYNKNIRPPQSVQVKFGLQLNQIVNVIERDQIILLNVFIDHEWRDQRLEWHPIDFQNVTVLRISSDFIWKYI
jgi:hypothetical protein